MARPTVAAALAAIVIASPARAAGPSFTAGPITVDQPWSRATPGGATVAAGYLTLRNGGDAPDRLVSASAEIAGRVGPHTMSMTKGVMEMRPLPNGIAIPAHGSVILSPGGDHLMLEQLKRPLRKGDHFAGTLVFEHAGSLAVTFTVEPVGARGPEGMPRGGMGMKME